MILKKKRKVSAVKEILLINAKTHFALHNRIPVKKKILIFQNITHFCLGIGTLHRDPGAVAAKNRQYRVKSHFFPLSISSVRKIFL